MSQTTPIAATARRGRGATPAARVAGGSRLYLVAIVLVAVFMGPFLWTVAPSLKTAERDRRCFPPSLLPGRAALGELRRRVFDAGAVRPLFASTSIQVTVLAVVGTVVSATLVAYGFARFRFPGRDALFIARAETLMLPSEVTIDPELPALQAPRLDRHADLPLIVPPGSAAAPFYIFLLRQFFMTLPRDLDEAAKIDGASSLHDPLARSCCRSASRRSRRSRSSRSWPTGTTSSSR